MKPFKITKLGAAIAIITAVAAPLATAIPASADEFRIETFDVHHDHWRRPVDQFDHRGHFNDHRYADYKHMRFRQHVRFQPYGWNWDHRGEMRSDR